MIEPSSGAELPVVLVAEDDETFRRVIVLTLEGARLRLVEAEDGPAAIELARRTLPRLVLLDWRMPGCSGLDVCRTLRAAPDTASAHLLMLTGHSGAADRAAALEAGADGFLTKPFSQRELLDRVAEVLGPGTLPP